MKSAVETRIRDCLFCILGMISSQRISSIYFRRPTVTDRPGLIALGAMSAQFCGDQRVLVTFTRLLRQVKQPLRVLRCFTLALSMLVAC